MDMNQTNQGFRLEEDFAHPGEWDEDYPTWEEYDDAGYEYSDPEDEENEYIEDVFEDASGDDLSANYSMAASLVPNGLPKYLFLLALFICIFLAAVVAQISGQMIFPASSATTASGGAQSSAGGQSQPASARQSDSTIANCAVSERFPSAIRRWCDTITQYASKHSLPPDLVAALILQESGGDPEAYSQSGAVGLMQVMPSDGLAASFQCANGPCFSSRPSTSELKDPEFNVLYGTKMLAGLVGRTGSLREALKSYGPMDVGYYYADKVLGIYQTYGN